jgi:HAD superfamily hydrolase (TIGR01450 family)
MQRFSEIVDRYHVLFFDSYGVLKNSKGLLDGVPEALADLRDRGKRLYVITNDSSRPPHKLAKAFEHPVYGPLIHPDHIISSGLLATRFLTRKINSGTVAYLGKDDSAHYIRAAGLRAKPVAECEHEEVSAIVLLDDEGFEWSSDLNSAVNIARRGPIPIIVANADLAYPVDGHRIAVAIGALGGMMERLLGRKFIYFGKPDTSMFSYAWAQVQALEPEVTKGDILMVGDTLETDILGANKFGLDTALVLSGNTRPEDAQRAIMSTGIVPDHVCASIVD